MSAISFFLSFFLRFPCGGSKFGDIDIYYKDSGSHLMRSLLGIDKLITTGIFYKVMYSERMGAVNYDSDKRLIRLTVKTVLPLF